MPNTLRIREQPMKRYLTQVLRSDRLSEPQLRIARLRYFTVWAALFVITIVATGEAKAVNTNGIEMYKALTRHGLRYKPNYGITVNEELVEIDGSHLSENIIKIPRGAVVDFESVLIKTKLDAVANMITKGTLVYTHYVTEFSHVIGEYIENLGFSVGYYTGINSLLANFSKGRYDALSFQMILGYL